MVASSFIVNLDAMLDQVFSCLNRMLVATGKQIILLGVIAGAPIVWFRVNEIEKVLELVRLAQYPEILKMLKEPERVLRFFFSSGIAGFVAGAAYLSLPVRLFVGWIPFVGRIDDFVAKSFVSGGLVAVALGFALQSHFS